jgi:hypothetical protein
MTYQDLLEILSVLGRWKSSRGCGKSSLRLQRAIRISFALAAMRNVTQQASNTLEDMKIPRLRMNWNMNDSWVKK